MVYGCTRKVNDCTLYNCHNGSQPWRLICAGFVLPSGGLPNWRQCGAGCESASGAR